MAKSPLIWQAEEGSITVGGTEYTTQVTDITITGLNRDAKIINAFGNQTYMVQTAVSDLIECGFTAIARDLSFADLVAGSRAFPLASPKTISGQLLARWQPNIVYTWRDSTDTNGPSVRIAIVSGLAVTQSWSQNVDGHLEETVTFKADPSKFRMDYTTYATGSPLPTL